MSAQNATPMTPPTRCDYRAKWIESTRRLGSRVTVDELAPKLVDAREFEVFHRFASFVVHGLKNSIAALATLSESALKKIDDREFQRDALHTVAQTVTRMQSRLGRLREAPHGG
jgi:signal transduction histidine kinase